MQGRQMNKVPGQSSTRRKRNKQPTMRQTSSNSNIIDYSVLGVALSSGANGTVITYRPFIPGNSNALFGSAGQTIAGFYSTGKFLPGTRIRWEPSVSFNTTGRVYTAFSDNPVVVGNWLALTTSQRGDFVKGLQDMISFPVWQETDITFPTRIRRKMFDVNSSVSLPDVNGLDRCMQTFMFIYVDGAPASISLGSFWFHDKLQVEGMVGNLTAG
jgi:hypothetical protein